MIFYIGDKDSVEQNWQVASFERDKNPIGSNTPRKLCTKKEAIKSLL